MVCVTQKTPLDTPLKKKSVHIFFYFQLTIQYTDEVHVAVVCDDNVDAEYEPEQHEETAGKFETKAAVTVGELETPAMHVAEDGQFDDAADP